MSKRIIYNQDNGIVAIIVPNEKYNLSVEAIAKKDVPSGKKYKIVDISEISSDRTFRNAWEIDEAELTDGVGE
tara:strand:- start:647 stop:865 length:219 start_codon:yes stop_codon:yes gene_type:complete